MQCKICWSEFLSSHGSCVRKQVNVQAAVNTRTGRNLYSPTLNAPDIQMSRPFHSPFLSHFLVINSLFGWRQQWNQAAVAGREQLGSPKVTTFYFCETTVFLREASWDMEDTQRGQGCLSSAIELQEEQLISEIIFLSLLLAKAKLVH